MGLAGQQIGAYTLINEIGQGGMGTVWLARRSDGRFERHAAVKFVNLALAGQGSELRFRREGSILGRLTHPHVAELFDAGISSGGQPYLILEYVDGMAIDQYCDQHKLDVEARVRLFLDVLEAVAYAHSNLIVHRDIKPSNVLVTQTGQVKLLDFGIAKLLQGDGQTGAATLLTREIGAALTPQYAAPEQMKNLPVTTATDVYALGVLLYVLLGGHHPAGPNVQSPAELIKAVLETEPRRLSDSVAAGDGKKVSEYRKTTSEKLQRQLRGDLDTIIGKAIKKDPSERYASVSAFADDLNRYLERRPIRARPDAMTYRVSKFVRRNRISVALAALSVLFLVGGAIEILIKAHEARSQRDFAFRQLARAEQLNQLNRFLLTDASPSNAPIAVGHLLSRAEEIVNKEDYADHPADHVGILISIGEQYSARGEVQESKRVLLQAYALAGKLLENGVRARAACSLAVTLDQAGEHAEAEHLIQEGLHELPEDSSVVLDRVSCLAQASEVAIGNGAAREAISLAQRAQSALEQSPIQSDNLKLEIMLDLGQAYALSGQPAQASAVYERAAGLVSKLGYDETRVAVDVLDAFGFAMHMAGHPKQAEQILRRAIDLTKAKGLEDASTPPLLLTYSRILYELERPKEAEPYGERALEKARSTGDEVTLEQSMLNLARIYRDEREFDRSEALLNKVEPLLRRELPAGHYAFAKLDNDRALLAAARGDFVTALRLNNQAINIMDAALKAGRQSWAPSLLVDRAGIELALHQPEKAYADVERAFSTADLGTGTISATRGRFYLARARALQALGRFPEAKADAQSAIEQLEPTAGSDYPGVIEAQQIVRSHAQSP